MHAMLWREEKDGRETARSARHSSRLSWPPQEEAAWLLRRMHVAKKSGAAACAPPRLFVRDALREEAEEHRQRPSTHSRADTAAALEGCRRMRCVHYAHWANVPVVSPLAWCSLRHRRRMCRRAKARRDVRRCGCSWATQRRASRRAACWRGRRVCAQDARRGARRRASCWWCERARRGLADWRRRQEEDRASALGLRPSSKVQDWRSLQPS
jgi:hypothetical protein